MAEHPSVFEAANYWFRQRVGLSVADRSTLLHIGGVPLQWSTGGGRGWGFIYLNHPLLNDTPLWEFALSQRRRLRDVSRPDLPSEFYGMNDSRGAQVFGADWSGHALRVPDGQVFFARAITNRSVLYVIRLGARKPGDTRGRMEAEYVTVAGTR